MHPEDFLSMADALQLFDIAKSSIGSMVKRIAEIHADPAIITKCPRCFGSRPKEKEEGRTLEAFTKYTIHHVELVSIVEAELELIQV